MKKIGMIVILFLLISIKVQAKEYDGEILKGEKIAGVFIRKEKNGLTRREYGQFLYRSTDKKLVYCLEPWEKLNNTKPYQEINYNHHEVLNLKESDFQKIELYAYFGYKYQNHQEDKWYAITQKKIWEVVDPEMDIYFTDKLVDGRRINPYEKEEDELEKLVANHLKKPSFDGQTYTVNYQENIKIVDTKKVLSTFDNQTSNELFLEKITEDQTYTFKKEIKDYDQPSVVYYQDDSQNVLALGKPADIKTSFKVHVTKGSIKINKVDTNNEVINNVVFEIYDNKKQLLDTKKTDLNGKILISNLPLGTYYIKEKEVPDGYILDDNYHEIILTKDGESKTLKLTNQKKPILPKTSGYFNPLILLLMLTLNRKK